MQLVNPNPSAAELRKFAWVIFVGLLLIGALLWVAEWHRLRPDAALLRWSGSALQVLALVLWIVGPVTGVTSLVSRSAGRRAYVVWMTGAMAMGIATTFVLLTVLYFVLLPAFSLIRLKDPLRVRLRGPAESYWEDHQQHESSLERTRRPF